MVLGDMNKPGAHAYKFLSTLQVEPWYKTLDLENR